MIRRSKDILIGLGIDGAELIRNVLALSDKYKKTIDDVTTSVKDAADPALYQAASDIAAEITKRREAIEQRLEEIGKELGEIEIFPNAFEDVKRFFNEATRQQNTVRKAFASRDISKEEFAKTETAYTALQSKAKELEECLLQAAELQAKKLDPAVYSKAMAALREQITDARNELNESRNAYREVSEGSVLRQKVRDTLAAQRSQNGVAAYHETVMEAFPETLKGLKEIFISRDLSKGQALIKKSLAKAQVIKQISSQKLANKDQNPLSATEKVIHKVALQFARVAETFATAADFLSNALSLLSGPFAFFQFISAANDRVRALNKELLGGRSLGELGFNVNADLDTSKVDQFFHELNSDFNSILMDASKNPYSLSPDEIKQEFANLKDIYLPRAAGDLQGGLEATNELMRFVNLNVTLQRRWGMSTSELAQKEAELANDFGYGVDGIRKTFGAIETISKKSNLSVSRLYGAAQSLAEKSPVFGYKLVETASFFTKLYDSKLFTTKEASSYIETLNKIFSDSSGLDKFAGAILNDTKSTAYGIEQYKRAIAELRDAGINTQADENRVKALEAGLKALEEAQKTGQAPDVSTLSVFKESLRQLPLDVKESMSAMFILGDKFDTPLKDLSDSYRLGTDTTLLGRARILAGAEAQRLLVSIARRFAAEEKAGVATASSAREIFNKNTLTSAKTAQEAMRETEKDLQQSADEFKPPLQEVKNFATGVLGQLTNLLESLTGWIDKWFASGAMKLLSDYLLGLGGSPSSETLDPDIMNKFSDAYTAVKDAQEALKSAKTPDERVKALDKYKTAVRDLAFLVGKHKKEADAFFQTATSNSFIEYTVLSGDYTFLKSEIPSWGQSLSEEAEKKLRKLLFGEEDVIERRRKEFKNPALNLKPLDSGEVLRDAQRTSKTPLVGASAIQVPTSGSGLIDSADVDKLEKLAKDSSDPRAVALAILRAKFGNSPFFAYILDKFLEKIDLSDS
ncbi:hypothetical protein EBR43_09550, partial [bacterium]|nr:hypothetical protein [bacterium]